MRLHKYRELKGGDSEAMARLQTILQTQALWCARPDTLNDDQEFSWRCDYQPTGKTIGLLAGLLSQERSWPFAEAWRQLESLIGDGSLESLASPVVASLIQQCRSEVGLSCFGTSPSNPTLWSRYGGNGEGVCIEIVVPDHLIGTSIFRVQYANEKVVHIDDLLRAHFGNAMDMYSHSLLTKPIKWSPEEEIRFVSSRQNVSVRIESAHVSCIYLGGMLSATVRERVTNIVKALPYEVELHEQPRA
jgi:hypothetical protein